jgi:P-type E1-E2 ATPase
LAELTPFEKAQYVKLRTADTITVMVGDGINDAVALKEATVGIAVGQQASDVAIDSADIVLIRPDIGILTSLLKLSSKAVKTVRTNLLWAFSYNIAAIPLAAAGILHPVVSAIFMSISSLLVVLNSQRIN